MPVIALLTLHVQLPGCTSLKQKRSQIKPVLLRLHREFNLSTSEIGLQDSWQTSLLACALVCTDAGYAQSALQLVLAFFESHWPDLPVLEHHIELI